MYSAIILNAGSGSRMNLGYNKMLYKYKGKTLLEYSLDLFTKNPLFNQIILVVSENDEDEIKKIIAGKYTDLKIVLGGAERQNSVMNGLESVSNEWVFIHDGARIFLTDDLLQRLDNKRNEIINTDVSGFALAVKSVDTTLKVKDNQIIEKLDRDSLYLMQTPQVSKVEELRQIFANNTKLYTDEMSAFLDNQKKVHIVEGEYYNKKITTMEDIKDE